MTTFGATAPGLGAGTIRVGRLGPRELVRIGAGGLLSRRLRSTLTAVGIAIGIAAMVAVLGISDASRASLPSGQRRLQSLQGVG